MHRGGAEGAEVKGGSGCGRRARGVRAHRGGAEGAEVKGGERVRAPRETLALRYEMLLLLIDGRVARRIRRMAKEEGLRVAIAEMERVLGRGR